MKKLIMLLLVIFFTQICVHVNAKEKTKCWPENPNKNFKFIISNLKVNNKYKIQDNSELFNTI